MLLPNNNNMRLFEIELENTVPTPEGEVEAKNRLNIIDEGGDFYSQIRTELDASDREMNQKYFDQTKLKIDPQDNSPKEYFNQFQFPNQNIISGLEDDFEVTYLPGRTEGYQRQVKPSSSYQVDQVPFLNDLINVENQRIHAERLFEEVQDNVKSEGVTKDIFIEWIQNIEPQMYELLLDNFQNLSNSEEFFQRDVVDEKEVEKEAFVEYMVKEVINQQKEQYNVSGPNDLSKEEVFEELPGYDDVVDSIPYLAEESHFETTLTDPFGQKLMEFMNNKQNKEEAKAFNEYTNGHKENRESEESEDVNILEQSGLNSVEGILTAKPEEVARFLQGGT